jgi:hypothetical protein
MLEVLDSLKDTITRFSMNTQDITEDALVGTKTIKVVQTRKFFVGETIVIRNDEQGEIRVIDQIIDEKTLIVTEELVASWMVSDGAMVQKAPGGQYIKRIYYGDPTVIPDYPAVTIMGDSRDEEWWTINSTKKAWNCTITVLVEDASDENSYRAMLAIAKSIEDALWINRWPIFDTSYETDVTTDGAFQDTVLEVDDTSGFRVKDQIVIEDLDRTQQNQIKQVIDDHNILLEAPLIWDFHVSEGATVYVPSRWVMWSKPESTDYGFVHKDTLLKAAQIKWFAEEEVCRLHPYIGPTKL